MATKRMAKEESAGSRTFLGLMVGIGGAVGLWATVAVAFALAQANWQVSELLRQYMIAIGVMKDFETWVDFYTHIKGVEYVLCAAFLVLFPFFFKFIERTKVTVEG